MATARTQETVLGQGSYKRRSPPAATPGLILELPENEPVGCGLRERPNAAEPRRPRGSQFASRAESTPEACAETAPCGVPDGVAVTVPNCVMTPAAKNFRISARTRLSVTRRRTCSISNPWRIAPKQFSTSPSITHSYRPGGLMKRRVSSIASCALRPGLNPYEVGRSPPRRSARARAWPPSERSGHAGRECLTS
jgi:hypothetical protein